MRGNSVPFVFCCIFIGSTGAQMYQSLVELSSSGLTFVPAHAIEYLVSIPNVRTLKQCHQHCHFNFLCRTFVYDSNAMLCTLYEGLKSTGNVLIANTTTSVVGALSYSADLFLQYGQPCGSCSDDRYLQCSIGSSFCACPIHSFFNGLICENQFYYGHSCSTTDSCRGELGLQCIVSTCQCSLGNVWNGNNCTISQTDILSDFVL